MNKIKHVCVIDDDELFQFVMRQHFERLGLVECIHKFTDGEQGLTYIKSHLDDPDELPDLILLDVNMPFMDGWQFMREFVQLPLPADKHIRVYILTSSTHESDLQRAKEFPTLSGYLVKPIGKNIIRELLSGAEQH
jgi:two-component system, chemotaxis family, chemotaxis protein CheY